MILRVCAVIAVGALVAGCGSSSGSGGSSVGAGGASGSQGASGSLATAYLSSATFSSLRVEVDYVVGAAPDQQALDLLRTRLQERCRKPGGITVVLDDAIPSPGVTSWSVADLRAQENLHREAFSTGSQAVLYVLYVDGSFSGDTQSSRVLGISYSGSAFCMFKESINASAALAPATGSTIEQAVIVHEAGHNLGLVNNGIPMQTPHQDSSNGAHDTDSSCVMHHTIETSLIAQITGTVPTQFGAHCVADMQAAGGL